MCSRAVWSFRRLRFVRNVLLMICIAIVLAISPASRIPAIGADKSAPESTARNPSETDPEASFADGWRKTVSLAEPNAEGKTPVCIAWVDKGWLIVERRDTAGDVGWQIVLAEAGEADEPPSIEQNRDVPGGLRLDYRGGRFFIHDDWGHLRCLRQKKSAEVKWPAFEIPVNDTPPGPSRMWNKNRVYYGRNRGGWQFIARAVKEEQVEYVLRMYCLEFGAFGFSTRSGRSDIDDVTVGATVQFVDSSTLQDDGELLVVRRMSEESLAVYRDRREKLEAKRKALVGAAPPEFSAATWLSSRRVALDNLKGSAALVYFTGGYSRQVIDELGALGDLHAKYYVRRLEVVVVVPAADEEAYAAISEKRGWKFLLAVDDHRNSIAKRFLIADPPSYVLIGRDGEIAASKYRAPSSNIRTSPLPPLPGADEIETLLGRSKP